MRPFLFVIAVFVLALPLVMANGDHGGGDEPHEQEIEFGGVVQPGGFGEIDFEMHGNGTVKWSAKSDEPMNVNIHQHDIQTHYLIQINGTTSESHTFTAPSEGVYSLMFVPAGEGPIDLDVRLDGTFALIGANLETRADSPAPGVVVFGALLGLLLVIARRR